MKSTASLRACSSWARLRQVWAVRIRVSYYYYW